MERWFSADTVEKNRTIIVFLFFAVFFITGLFVAGDYGVPWDEFIQRDFGIAAHRHAFEGDKALLSLREKYYGPAFEMLLVAVERTFGPKDPRRVIFIRHLVTFLMFFTGAVFFYFLCKIHFRSWKLALLGSLMLILSPRVFAHAFYNSKDIPCMSLFIICAYTLIRYLDDKSLKNVFLHGLACALLVDVRIMGVIMPVLTVFLLLDELWVKRSHFITPFYCGWLQKPLAAFSRQKVLNVAHRLRFRAFCPSGLAKGFFAQPRYKRGYERASRKITKEKKDILISLPLYLIVLVFFTVFFWPVLWERPFHNFVMAFTEMSLYPYPVTVLYLGNYIDSTNVPWHYMPVWILISTPAVYVLLFFSGLAVLTAKLIKNAGKPYPVSRNEFIFLYWFFVPVTAVIVLRSALYDAWRQMFFVYPAFLVLSLTGLRSIFEFMRSRSRRAVRGIGVLALVSVLAAGMACAAWFTVRYHPHQNVYFNVLTGGMRKARKNFDLDYWGLSYRKALEYIAENDPAKTIKVYVVDYPGIISYFALAPADRKRIIYVNSPEKADYFVSNYRWHRGEYPYSDEFFSIKVGGEKIMVVYRLEN
ncbi:MAG: glycosyltransferase family 39 protein [Candidatus Omnitrophota bacterium]|nr:glycosyltransferase family 39 protein [Candidatus Omnitrophota bacterium]